MLRILAPLVVLCDVLAGRLLAAHDAIDSVVEPGVDAGESRFGGCPASSAAAGGAGAAAPLRRLVRLVFVVVIFVGLLTLEV